jgi:hypothetical protein
MSEKEKNKSQGKSESGEISWGKNTAKKSGILHCGSKKE